MCLWKRVVNRAEKKDSWRFVLSEPSGRTFPTLSISSRWTRLLCGHCLSVVGFLEDPAQELTLPGSTQLFIIVSDIAIQWCKAKNVWVQISIMFINIDKVEERR